jgi:hypothetical protein
MREATIDPMIIEVPQASHEVGLTPHSTGVKTVTEEDPRFCIGRKLPYALPTDRTREEVDQSPEGDSETLELTASMSGGPRRSTRVLRNVVGHAEVASSKGPPLLGEARLFEGDASALDDTTDGTLGNPVGLGPARDRGVELPAELTCRGTEFGSTVRVKTLDELVAHEGEESFLRVLR